MKYFYDHPFMELCIIEPGVLFIICCYITNITKTQLH